MSEETTKTAARDAGPKVRPKQRLDLAALAPEQYRAMAAFNRTVEEGGLEHPLLELVKMRASQLNGCAYCIDMHSKDAMADGETAQRLFALSAWWETPFFTARERSALALTEAVTLMASRGPVPDDVWDAAATHFGERELALLLWAIAAINTWNAVSATNRNEVGGYRPGGRA